MTTAAGPPEGYPDALALAGFLVTVFDDLDTITWLRGPLFAPGPGDVSLERVEMLRAMDQAWREVVETRLDVVYETLGRSNPELARAGLAGAQLQFKLAAWRDARADALSEFVDGVPPTEVSVPGIVGGDGPAWEPPTGYDPLPGVQQDLPTHEPLPPVRPRRLRRALKKVAKVLGISDVVIDSLASIINVAELVKEFKQTTEKLASDVADEQDDQDERPDSLDI